MSSKPNLKNDIIAGVVVSLVAIPLCLGIALSSGMPPFAGMISGILGGIVIGCISRSQLSVSGPAAGLITIVATGITDIGINGVLLAVFLAGLFQIGLSLLKAGGIAYYFPSSVIEGMLAAIGITIILKNIPTLLGFPEALSDEETGFQFYQRILSDVSEHVNEIALGTGIVALICMVLWDKYKPKILKTIPGALIAVIVGLVSYFIFQKTNTSFEGSELVQLPVVESFNSFTQLFLFPNFGLIANPKIWVLALTIGMVASIETLLTIEATDKIDPLRRVTPTNRELFAQGIGNSLSGLIGGLPITSVIVRSKAGLVAGGRTKTTTIVHGIILLLGVLFIAKFLNMIPLASLAAILVVTGYKLCNPALFKHVFSLSKHQWIPFVITVLAILLTDLLKGVGIGMLVAVYFILRGNMKSCYTMYITHVDNQKYIHLILSEEISFLKKSTIIKTLSRIKNNSNIIIDAEKTVYIDFDVLELIREFKAETAPRKNINLKLINFKDVYEIPNNGDGVNLSVANTRSVKLENKNIDNLDTIK
ncbi:SulP family inorganic anion transporter [Apibacter raozihei]|uniref:SulP family inorganic anion transporter n=1 Tax=Apibacter raozihei TaxID=2500547 RepID=UPI000FE30EDD|nr:SulP family inorganic anion transporter [Apibacter raozihei]